MPEIPSEIQQAFDRQVELRSHYYQPPTIGQRLLGLIASGKYAQQPIVFDISHWQSSGSGTTRINFPAFATYPQFAGWYVKLGQVGKEGKPFTMESDAWFDDMFTPFWAEIEKHPAWWRAPYLYHNSSWMDDYGQTLPGLDNILDQPEGQTDDAHATQLCQDPNIYLIVRRYMKAGRVFTGADLRQIMANMTYLRADAIIVDFEKYYDNAGRTVLDIHLGKTLDLTMKALVWLQEHGYLPQVMLIIYTSEWFLKAYANVYGRNVCNQYNTIAAGYYWNNIKVTTTFQGMMDQIATIQNDWHPYYVGAAVPGLRNQFLQISGDHFVLDVHPYAVDCNVFNGSWAEMEATFPSWKARRTVPPPVTCPPGQHKDPVTGMCVPDVILPPVTKKVITVTTTAGLRVRENPNTLAGTEIYTTLLPGTTIDVDTTRAILDDGMGTVWAPMMLKGWMCVKLNGVQLGTITDKSV
jgi:hypothetical protein